MTTDNHYVNNKKMLECLIEYNNQLKYNIENNLPKPKIPEYFGECVLKIATHLSFSSGPMPKPNFINYPTYKEDMISDGVENCLICIKSFNVEKYSNPFSYFTQVIYFAFIRRITKEKRRSELKAKLIRNIDYDTYAVDIQDMSEDYKNMFTEYLLDHQLPEPETITPKPIDVSKLKVKPLKVSLDMFFV